MTMRFADALADVSSGWRALVPPTRMRVSEGAAKNFKIARPGGAVGYWDPFETPYMVEPMDMLASRTHSAVCFVGPSQTGKTAALGEGWLAHVLMNDPGDMLFVQMTQEKAREYSRQRIDRMVRHSDAIRAMLSRSPRDDNTHDKLFRNGMWVRFAWPTATNLSSTSYRYVFGTDYDRWPDDIDGEGDGFTLMGKRTTTFQSRGKHCVESSPGRPIKNPLWKPETPHEAPPVGGILGVYNRSTRCRWQWRCPECSEHFEAEPGLGLFRLPSDSELLESIRSIDIDKFARQHARVVCPHCASLIPYEQRERMNREGVWLREGLSIDSHGRVSGNPRTSSIAGYWLGGVAATYVKWFDLLQKHLQALLEFELTGNEEPLQTTANTDQGVPYMSKVLQAAAEGREDAKHDSSLQRYVVPSWARFLAAAVDVQGGKNARFVVQVHAVGPYREQALVDRYAITTSTKRKGTDGEDAAIDPARHVEDWDVITDKVLGATYRIEDAEGLELRIRRVAVDSGGEEGVTDKAYEWRRTLHNTALAQRVVLTKGDSVKADWLLRETMVGGKQKGVAKNDVPLLLFNTDRFKDIVSAGRERRTPGPGYYHFPPPQDPHLNPDGWLSPAFYEELDAEVRNERGVWEQIKKRNEAFDLCAMINVVISTLGADRPRFWQAPPSWALELSVNSDVVTAQQRREAQQAPRAASLPLGRQVSRSSYLSG